jgi:hypothetical protein
MSCQDSDVVVVSGTWLVRSAGWLKGLFECPAPPFSVASGASRLQSQGTMGFASSIEIHLKAARRRGKQTVHRVVRKSISLNCQSRGQRSRLEIAIAASIEHPNALHLDPDGHQQRLVLRECPEQIGLFRRALGS